MEPDHNDQAFGETLAGYPPPSVDVLLGIMSMVNRAVIAFVHEAGHEDKDLDVSSAFDLAYKSACDAVKTFGSCHETSLEDHVVSRINNALRSERARITWPLKEGGGKRMAFEPMEIMTMIQKFVDVDSELLVPSDTSRASQFGEAVLRPMLYGILSDVRMKSRHGLVRFVLVESEVEISYKLNGTWLLQQRLPALFFKPLQDLCRREFEQSKSWGSSAKLLPGQDDAIVIEMSERK